MLRPTWPKPGDTSETIRAGPASTASASPPSPTGGGAPGRAAQEAARPELPTLSGEAGRYPEAGRRAPKARNPLGYGSGGSASAGSEDGSHLRTPLCRLLVRVSAGAFAPHGDAEGLARDQ